MIPTEYLTYPLFQSDYKHIDFLWGFVISRDLEEKIFILQILRGEQWDAAWKNFHREMQMLREKEGTEEAGGTHQLSFKQLADSSSGKCFDLS